MTYKIPLIGIHDTLVNISKHKKILKFNKQLDKFVKENRINYGIKGSGYKVLYDLEAQWYPVYWFSNKWLASYFVEEILMSK